MKKIIAVLALLTSAVFLFGQDKPEPSKTEPAKTTPAPAATHNQTGWSVLRRQMLSPMNS